MKTLALLLAGLLGCGATLFAQDLQGPPATRHLYFDGALLLGLSTGSLASDIPTRVPWGFRLGARVPLSTRLSLRLSVEDLFFQVHDRDFYQGPVWMNEDATFDSLRAGVDLLFEPRGLRAGGPYYLIGAGSQYSSATTTLYRYRDAWPYGKDEVGEATRAERTSAYFTVGAGWRWQRTYAELRLFNVNYDASAAKAPGLMTQTYRSSVVIEVALGCRL